MKKSTKVILGSVAGVVLIAGIASAAGEGESTSKTPSAVASDSPRPKEQEPAKKEEKVSPLNITAEKAEFAKSILAQGSDYTSVRVTITNNSGESVSVNPLYFTITDTNGTKHTAELGADKNQVDTVTLADGENISGTITGKGSFTAKYVTYTEAMFGEPIRADVK